MSSPTRSFLAAGLLLAAGTVRAGIAPGERFPSLTQAGVGDGRVPATAGKVVLVDFWASWCAPCRASFPVYAKLESEFAARGLVIVAVSVDRDPVAFADFRRRFRPPFATLRDRDQTLVREVDVPAMPTCFLLGRDHRVRFMHEGFHGAATERELHREIESLLAEPASPP